MFISLYLLLTMCFGYDSQLKLKTVRALHNVVIIKYHEILIPTVLSTYVRTLHCRLRFVVRRSPYAWCEVVHNSCLQSLEAVERGVKDKVIVEEERTKGQLSCTNTTYPYNKTFNFDWPRAITD